jgi:hypothetical protein
MEVNNMPRQRKTDKYRLIEGRGTGRGEKYTSWLKVHEFGSKSRRHRIIGWKQKRIYQLMSDLELYYFLVMQWEDRVIDINEQYPLLPIEETILIADEYGIIHPPRNSKKVEDKMVMSTDFVLTVNMGKVVKQIARTIKPVSDLGKLRVLEKFKIEQEYWKKKGINWGIVTDEQIPKIKAQNIYYIYHDYFWPEERGYSNITVDRFVYEFKNILSKNALEVLKSINEFEGLKQWQQGEGLNFFKFLLVKKKVYADFDTKLDFHNMKVWLE